MSLWKYFLNAMTAATFAEAAEFDTAREMTATGNRPTRKINAMARQWAAVAFAEAGEFESARGMIDSHPGHDKEDQLTTLTDAYNPC